MKGSDTEAFDALRQAFGRLKPEHLQNARAAVRILQRTRSLPSFQDASRLMGAIETVERLLSDLQQHDAGRNICTVCLKEIDCEKEAFGILASEKGPSRGAASLRDVQEARARKDASLQIARLVCAVQYD